MQWKSPLLPFSQQMHHSLKLEWIFNVWYPWHTQQILFWISFFMATTRKVFRREKKQQHQPILIIRLGWCEVVLARGTWKKAAPINSKSFIAPWKSNHSTRLKYWKAAVLRNGSWKTSELHSEVPGRRYVGLHMHQSSLQLELSSSEKLIKATMQIATKNP